MSFIGKVGESVGSIAIGVGVIAVAPFLARALRPLAKELVKGGIYLNGVAKEYIAESGEELADLIAEARSEMKTTGQTPHNGSS